MNINSPVFANSWKLRFILLPSKLSTTEKGGLGLMVIFRAETVLIREIAHSALAFKGSTYECFCCHCSAKPQKPKSHYSDLNDRLDRWIDCGTLIHYTCNSSYTRSTREPSQRNKTKTLTRITDLTKESFFLQGMPVFLLFFSTCSQTFDLWEKIRR